MGTVSMACKSIKSLKKLPIFSCKGSVLSSQSCYEYNPAGREGKVLFLSFFLKERDFCGLIAKDIRC